MKCLNQINEMKTIKNYELCKSELVQINGGETGDSAGWAGYIWGFICGAMQAIYENIKNAKVGDPALMEVAKNNPVAIWN